MKIKMCNNKRHAGPHELPVSEFHKDKHAYDGLRSKCKHCSRRDAREWRSKKAQDPKWRAKFNESNRCYRRAGGKQHQLFCGARDRARKHELEFSIIQADVVIPDRCPILGIPINQEMRGHGKGVGGHFDAPSIDRIDNSRGYTPDNIQVISWRANHLKNTASLQEMVQLGDWAKQQLEP